MMHLHNSHQYRLHRNSGDDMNTVFRQALTLIESMVVLAITGVLIVVLLPAVHMAWEMSSSTKCVSEADDPRPRRGLHLTASAVPDSDWPAYRRDPGLSGFSPLIGGLGEAPTVRWSVELGGSRTSSEQAQLVDVNGDGR